MNEQNNNIGNIIPPSIIPETKDTNIGQINNQIPQNNLSGNLNNMESNTSTQSNLINNNFIDSNVDVNSNIINNTNQITNNTLNEQENYTTNNRSDIESNSIDNSNDNNIISVKKYLINMILFMIPIVGPIILIIKVFDKKDKNINNFAKAKLIADTIKIIILIICGFILSIVIKKVAAKYLEQYLTNLINQNQQAIYENFIDSFGNFYNNSSDDTNYNYNYDYDIG